MISRASSTLRCNDIHSLTLSISSIYASSISWFIQFRVDTTVVGLACLYTVLAFLTTLSIEYPLQIEHVIPVVRYLPPFILDIDDFSRSAFFIPHLSLDIYVYVYLIPSSLRVRFVHARLLLCRDTPYLYLSLPSPHSIHSRFLRPSHIFLPGLIGSFFPDDDVLL